MTMKRILHCMLMFMVLVTSGCGFFADETTSTPNANSSPAPETKNNIDFAGAERALRKAIDQLNSQGELATVQSVKDDINDAIKKLGKVERDRCTDCTEYTKAQTAEVFQSLNQITNPLGRDAGKEITEFDQKIIAKLKDDLGKEADNLKRLDALNNPTESPSPSPSPTQTEASKIESDAWGLSSLLMLAAKIVIVLLALVLIASALSFLWKRAWKTVEINVGRVLTSHLATIREAQTDYSPKFASLSSTQSEMCSQLTALDTEVRSLARLVRESLAIRRNDGNPSYGGFNYQSHAQETPPKDEPEFPVSVFDYLGKMNRFANVVKPDFQNGILVNDPDGAGELVLIRDSRDETQPLFVVPRAKQFQTKQDFYTYYQKYYDCVRPSSGDVWIIGPAVVEKVAGGWQLREKGMLEVR